jgi:hypothetical protein
MGQSIRVTGGSIRQKATGRWQARHRAPDGRQIARTFDTKTDARAWLAAKATDRRRGEWHDDRFGQDDVSGNGRVNGYGIAAGTFSPRRSMDTGISSTRSSSRRSGIRNLRA